MAYPTFYGYEFLFDNNSGTSLGGVQFATGGSAVSPMRPARRATFKRANWHHVVGTLRRQKHDHLFQRTVSTGTTSGAASIRYMQHLHFISERTIGRLFKGEAPSAACRLTRLMQVDWMKSASQAFPVPPTGLPPSTAARSTSCAFYSTRNRQRGSVMTVITAVSTYSNLGSYLASQLRLHRSFSDDYQNSDVSTASDFTRRGFVKLGDVQHFRRSTLTSGRQRRVPVNPNTTYFARVGDADQRDHRTTANTVPLSTEFL